MVNLVLAHVVLLPVYYVFYFALFGEVHGEGALGLFSLFLLQPQIRHKLIDLDLVFAFVVFPFRVNQRLAPLTDFFGHLPVVDLHLVLSGLGYSVLFGLVPENAFGFVRFVDVRLDAAVSLLVVVESVVFLR